MFTSVAGTDMATRGGAGEGPGRREGVSPGQGVASTGRVYVAAAAAEAQRRPCPPAWPERTRARGAALGGGHDHMAGARGRAVAGTGVLTSGAAGDAEAMTAEEAEAAFTEA